MFISVVAADQGLLGGTCLRQLQKHKCVDNDNPCTGGIKIPGFCNTGVCCFQGSADDCDKAGGKCIATRDCKSDVFAAHTPHCPGSNEVKCCINTKKECQSFSGETQTYCSSEGHCKAAKRVFAKDDSFECGKAEGCCVGEAKADMGCRDQGGKCMLASVCDDQKGELRDARGLCPGKKVKCCIPKKSQDAKQAQLRQQAEKVQNQKVEAQSAKLQAAVKALDNGTAKAKAEITEKKKKTDAPKKEDIPKPAEDKVDEKASDGTTTAALLEIATTAGHKLRLKTTDPSRFPKTQGYAAAGQGVKEPRIPDEFGVVTIPEKILKAEHLENQVQSHGNSILVEECVGCQFILGQLELLVGNTANEMLVSRTLTSLCYEAMGTIIESACTTIHTLLDDITTDYLDGKDTGTTCERNGLCRGGHNPLQPSL